MPDDVLDMIGTAAALEQLAEESAELAQAALKTMAAKHRRWNERLHDEKLWEVDSHED